jgi:hypothetical protein
MSTPSKVERNYALLIDLRSLVFSFLGGIFMDCLPNTPEKLFDCLVLLMFFTILGGIMVFYGF